MRNSLLFLICLFSSCVSRKVVPDPEGRFINGGTVFYFSDSTNPWSIKKYSLDSVFYDGKFVGVIINPLNTTITKGARFGSYQVNDHKLN